MEAIRLIAGERVWRSVLANARTSVTFQESAYDEALIRAKDIFGSEVDPNRVKEVLNKPVVTGHRIRRFESSTASKGLSKSRFESEAQSTSRSISHSIGESSSSGEGESASSAQSISTSSGASLAEALYIPADSGELSGRNESGVTMITCQQSGLGHGSSQDSSSNRFETRSKSASETSASAYAEATGVGQGETQSVSNTIGSSEGLEPILEWLPSAAYSLEEQFHVAAVRLLTLPARHAIVKLAGGRPQEIRSLDVPLPTASEAAKDRTLSDIKSAHHFLQPRAAFTAALQEQRHGLERQGPAPPSPSRTDEEDFFQ